ncbi:MAG: CHASE3 domain-containing protein, partial [Luteibacter sp.]
MSPRASDANSLRSRADRRTTFALACAIVFFIVSGFVAWQNIATIRGDNQKVIQSQETVTALSEVLSAVQDAETGQRGFLLTGNDRYLEPYRAALASIPARLASIRNATRDNP